MAALTGNTIASTYKDLIQVSNSNNGIDGTSRAVSDGEATASLLFLDTARVGVGIAATDGILHVHRASAGSVTANTSGDELVVENNGDTGISILCPDANIGRLIFGSPTDNNNSLIASEYNSGNQRMYLSVDGTAVMYLLDTSRVGIGTSAPDATLHIKTAVEGDIADGATNVAQLVVESTATGSTVGPHIALLRSSASEADADFIGKISFLGDDTVGEAAGDTSNATNYASIYGQMHDVSNSTTDGALYFKTNIAGTETNQMYMAQGRIAIGDFTNPDGVLEIQQTTTAGHTLKLYRDEDDPSAGMVYIKQNHTGDDNTVFSIVNDSTDAAGHCATFVGGNVGIGTASPAALFHVEEDTANESCTVKIKNASSNGAGEGGNIICDTGGTTHCIVGGYYNGTAMAGVLGMTDDAGNFAYFYHDDDGENSLRASENNTHIGTTAPNGQLIADQSSDERVKTISSGTFPYGLEEVNKLTPIKYKLKKKIRDKSVPKKIIVKEKEVDNPEYNKVIGWEDNSDAPYKLGLGAQSTIPHIPEPFSDTGMYVDGVSTKYAMAYWQMIPVLVKAIQELSAKVTALENA